MTTLDLDRLRGPILRSVSRSFYLSLRLLPEVLRDPVSLAYLLARTTDTIADTPGLPVDLRVESLQKLARVIQETDHRADLAEIGSAFVTLQGNEAERTLMEALPAVMEWLDLLSADDRTEVRRVLEKINRGQRLDLERFERGEGIRALATEADLDEYTYLVAGCVGEFWTRLCFAHIRSLTDRMQSEMEELGSKYGKGLQLTNILRDAGADLRQGRCYLPLEQLQPLGLTPEELLASPEKTEPVLATWRKKATDGLDAGLE